MTEEHRTTEQELADVEREITETKERLAALKQRRRVLYDRKEAYERGALAQAAAEMGVDYDAFMAQMKRHLG